jgi:hypothetical protein
MEIDMQIETHPYLGIAPCASLDWVAVTSEYAGEWTDPVGYGETPEAAVEDLLSQLEPGTFTIQQGATA